MECRDCPISHASRGPSNCPFRTEAVSAGERLFRRGEVAENAWFVKSGVIGTGNDVLDLRSAGSFVGLDCLISSNRLSDAVAEIDSKLCAIARPDLIQWLGNNEARLRLIVDAGCEDPEVAKVLDARPG